MGAVAVSRPGFVVCSLVILTTIVAGPPPVTAQDADPIARQVERLVDDLDLDEVEISVDGTEVTLAGPAPTLWVKTQAINRALEIDGVETVASELVLPEVDDDDEIAKGGWLGDSEISAQHDLGLRGWLRDGRSRHAHRERHARP